MNPLKISFEFNTPKLDFKKNQRVKKKVREQCFAALRDKFIDELEFCPRYRENIQIIYTRASKIPMDQDGVAATSKYWIDGLTKLGVIKDDKPISAGGHVDLVFNSEKGAPKTTIEIKLI